MTDKKEVQKTSIGFSLVVQIIMTSAIGLLAGLLLKYGLSSMGLPYIAVLPFLALWWAYIIITIVPIIMFVQYFHSVARTDFSDNNSTNGKNNSWGG